MVNILEVDISELKQRYLGWDLLTAMFDLQRKLNRKFYAMIREKVPEKKHLGYPDNGFDINTKEAQIEARRVAYYLVEELMEGMNLLKNREWMETEIPVDRNHLADEVADVLHYFVLLMQILGYEPDDLYELYLKKHLVNEFRLESGY